MEGSDLSSSSESESSFWIFDDGDKRLLGRENKLLHWGSAGDNESVRVCRRGGLGKDPPNLRDYRFANVIRETQRCTAVTKRGGGSGSRFQILSIDGSAIDAENTGDEKPEKSECREHC